MTGVFYFQEFGVSLNSPLNSVQDLHEVVCLDEMAMEPFVERIQAEISSSNNSNSIHPVGLEKVIS